MTEEKPWYDGQASGAMDDFIALEATYRVDSLVSALDAALERQGGPGGRSLTDAEWAIIAVNSLEERVNMGGYASFFEHERHLVPIALPALTLIGATECAKLTQEAFDVPGVAALLSGNTGTDALDEAAEDALNSIDQRYFDHGIAMCDDIWAFVKTNRHKISLDGGRPTNPPGSNGFLSRLLGALRGRRT